MVVDRAAATEVVVVPADLGQPVARDAASAGDVLEEGQHVVGLLGSAEGDEQQGVVRARHRGACGNPRDWRIGRDVRHLGRNRSSRATRPA